MTETTVRENMEQMYINIIDYLADKHVPFEMANEAAHRLAGRYSDTIASSPLWEILEAKRSNMASYWETLLEDNPDVPEDELRAAYEGSFLEAVDNLDEALHRLFDPVTDAMRPLIEKAAKFAEDAENGVRKKLERISKGNKR